MLAGCGNSIGLDKEKAKTLIIEEALSQKVIEEGGYKKEDIEVLKACKAIEEGEEKSSFNDQYLIYWQTSDGEYKRDLMLDAKENKVYYGTSRHHKLNEEDACTEF